METRELLLYLKLWSRRFGFYRRIVQYRREAGAAIRDCIVKIAKRCTSGLHWFGPPNGLYSLTCDLRVRSANSKIVLESQGILQCGPESLLAKSGLHQNECQPWPIIWDHLTNVRLCGRSLAVVNEHKQLAIESVYGSKPGSRDPAASYFMRGRPVHLYGNWTSIVSRWVPVDSSTNYAHWLFDALPRLALLEKFPEDTKIIVPSFLQDFQEASLRWLGLFERCRPTSETYIRPDAFYFSGPVSMIVCYSPYSIEFLRTRLLAFGAKTSETPKRFFLKRKGLLRSLVNQEEVESFFKATGWSVIDTGSMKFEDQIAHFRDAEAIVAVHGAGVANIVWASPGCKVLELVPDNYLNGCYEWMSEVLNIEYKYELFPADSSMNAFVDLNRLEKTLLAWGVL